jgi:hypothetical protein
MEVQARGHSQGGLEKHGIRNVSAVYCKDDKPYWGFLEVHITPILSPSPHDRRASRLPRIEHDRRRAAGLLESVNGADVRLIERGEHLRLAAEPGDPIASPLLSLLDGS